LKIIWVLENIEKNKNFYSKFNILLLITSAHLWKKNNPEDTCVLYADDMTIDVLDNLKVLNFWDQIKNLPKPSKINKSVFWASAKLQVLAEINEPIILMDNDTHVYKPIKEYLDLSKVYVTNYEIGIGYYPTSIDPYVRQLSYKPRWQTNSVNVSFLNLPTPEFTKRYAEKSLKMMEEFTALNAPNSQYLIFAEQLLLRYMLDKEKIEHKSIVSTFWDCKQWKWGEEHTNGIWTVDESEQYFKHYGPLKGWYLNNRKGFSYENEINHLVNCINFPNLDLSKITKR
jgi:hypothetical protein